MRDIADLTAAGFKVHDDSGEDVTDMTSFCVTLKGPKDSLYESGAWDVRFTIPPEYPFKSPSVGFVQTIMHPNIDLGSGSVCLDALNGKWSPCFTLKHCMDTLLPYLLMYPNPDDPLNRDAAVLLKNNKDDYSRQVILAIRAHALPLT